MTVGRFLFYCSATVLTLVLLAGVIIMLSIPFLQGGFLEGILTLITMASLVYFIAYTHLKDL